ncbi:hypothetical protein K1719_018377 [Acacia pycnantha]|nr:hypothetical protein K1719_018377 [Acacia pycnantha]
MCSYIKRRCAPHFELLHILPPLLQAISESCDIMDMKEENREVGDSRVSICRRIGRRTKGRSFAYVDFIPSPTDQNSLSKLFSRYNGCLWKGRKLKLEKAKEHYLVQMPGKESLKTKKLWIFFPKLRKVKSIPFTGTGKHKYSFPKVEVPPLPVHFCDCEEHYSPFGTIRPKQFRNREAEGGGMDDEEINLMNVVINKLFERENLSSPTHVKKEQNCDVSPGGLQSDESEADSLSDDDGLIINMETKKKKTDKIGCLELERILRNQESELNKAKVLKDEPNKNKLEVQKSNNIAPGKKRKPRNNFEGKRNDSTSATPEGKRRMHKQPDKMSSQVRSTELGSGFSEPTKVSWSQKSSWRELLGDGGSSSFNASHMLLDSNSSEKQGFNGFCEPESAKICYSQILGELHMDLSEHV